MKNSNKTTKQKSARKGPPDLGHVRCKIRVVIAVSNTPGTVVQTVGDLRADGSSLLWVSTIASLADMFRYMRLNTLKLRVWPAVSSSYAAATYWPSSFLYAAPAGSTDPTASAEVESHPRLMGEVCAPYVFPQSSLCTSSQWVPRECCATLKVKNSDFTLTAETDRPGCLVTQNDGVVNTYGRVFIIKRSAGSGTSTNYDCQMDMDVSFFDIVDPATLTRLMEHRTNPTVQMDPHFLQSAVQNYSSQAMVKSPSTPTTPDSKDELILKLKQLLSQ